ncbi:MAG: iron chelate uptake ABC transporter family permease subunit [SAR202 cluster bacterium]|nr:iron chelate uptake ABC transporter family permease subunit [SAR202 cluster bacterium]MDP6665624.1 iron chelate uptake ABC transporter family permease subunit [SAR202 cluster bacterium]MDP6798662.1 iron chelate uptake ABC transporter family permease subunit [SAR202 cluster bacterium]
MSQSARELRARASESGDRPIPASVGLRYPWWRLVVAVGVVGMLAILAVSQGSVGIPPLTVAKILASKLPVFDPTADWPGTSETILLQLRLPRVALAGIVGAALATSGAAYQGLFKNPLADPYLIGVASGAGLGATIVLITGVPLFVGALNLLPVAAFAGGLGAVSLAYMIARRSTGTPLTTLILAGVAIASLAGAATSLLMVRSDPDLRPLLSWLLGGFISARWSHSAIVLVYLVPAAAVLAGYGRILNVLQLDEDHAAQLGVNVERTKLLLVGSATLATAAAVSFSGLIGFVGLVAPHVVRLAWGGDYRFLLPMSALVGAGFLILADLVARTIVSPAELPVGVVTAFCGAPFFLYLLRSRKAVGL